HQIQGPGLAVTVSLLAELVAEQRASVDADQHGLSALKDLVVGTDAYAGQVVATVDLASVCDGGVDDVVNRSEGDGVAQTIAEDLNDTAIRAARDQDQGEDELAQPSLGDGQVEEDLLGLGLGFEGLVESLVCDVGLPVDELSADLELSGQRGDRSGAGEGVNCQSLAL